MPRTAPRPALLLAAALLHLAGPAQADDVVVFAASSLKTALDRIAADFRDDTGHRVAVSYAASGQLAAQVIAGAPADIFVSAAVSWMDAVESEGLLVPGTRTDLLGNRLVMVAGAGAPPLDFGDGPALAARLGDGRLAMAMVDSVPAGQYGKAALTTLGLWDSLAPQVAQTDNVRAALALVATGEAPLGIVYASDARAEPAVAVVATFAGETHPAIRYPAALLAGADDGAARAFFQTLSSPAADAIFAAQGFETMDGGE